MASSPSAARLLLLVAAALAEAIVFAFLKDAIRKDVGLAAALLRIHFHDCFVQGCDGSVLLDRTNGVDSEKLAGGPRYAVPLGRRDGLAPASLDTILGALPPPTSKVPVLLSFLAKIGLNADDLVALSGAHTLGIAHCGSFEERLFPKDDPTMDKFFAGHLKLTCPRLKVDNFTANDIRTPDVFDNKFYVDLLNRQGLFTSDQDLHTDAKTKPMVTRFAVDQAAFFDQFVKSMVKMGQINVLTGNQGQIRTDCSVPNAARSAGDELPWSVVETAVETLVL
ncbi:Peroxidase 12 [Triticum urartu]|uniref:peroxidase n=1 Tax=Triticum urartu TaxID=4572 RepID=M8A564_TRIUA|nr:Peroxidase 12 [Triticum urartu]